MIHRKMGAFFHLSVLVHQRHELREFLAKEMSHSSAVQWMMGRQLTVSLTLTMSSKACHFEDAFQDWSQIQFQHKIQVFHYFFSYITLVRMNQLLKISISMIQLQINVFFFFFFWNAILLLLTEVLKLCLLRLKKTYIPGQQD